MALKLGVLLLWALLLWGGTPARALAVEPVTWKTVAEGLWQAEVPLAGTKAVLVCVRLDPARMRFGLYMASEDGAGPMRLGAWMERHEMLAAINASMYLPDQRTSIGYLRNETHENNRRIAARLGAFFVAEPREPGLPLAAIVDKQTDDYESLLPRYSVVVQNFRLFSPEGKNLWPKNAPNAHSIAAVGQDRQGLIYFFHCAEPMTVHDFTAWLLRLPLGLSAAMYVEGGSEAQLSLRGSDRIFSWMGRNTIIPGMTAALPLPNVLGAQPR